MREKVSEKDDEKRRSQIITPLHSSHWLSSLVYKTTLTVRSTLLNALLNLLVFPLFEVHSQSCYAVRLLFHPNFSVVLLSLFYFISCYLFDISIKTK